MPSGGVDDLPRLDGMAHMPSNRRAIPSSRKRRVPIGCVRPELGEAGSLLKGNGVIFSVAGIPITEGNITPWGTHRENKKTAKGEKNRLDAWRGTIRTAFLVTGQPCIAKGPVRLVVDFYLRPPKKIPTDREGQPCVRPDLSKLLRAVEDALTGVAYADDAQICAGGQTKSYRENPGVLISVERS